MKRQKSKKKSAKQPGQAPASTPQHTYQPAPKTLPAFPDAKLARRKTPVQGGGGKLRKRWKDYKGKKIYEWDYQHGNVEKWNWTGKNHEGGYDPATGNLVSLPDATKKPITPTITKLMKAKVNFGLTWFSAKRDKLVGEEDLPKLTSKQVRKWFFLPDDDPLTDCYIVRASQRQHLAKIAKSRIDLNKYDYFLECSAPEPE